MVCREALWILPVNLRFLVKFLVILKTFLPLPLSSFQLLRLLVSNFGSSFFIILSFTSFGKTSVGLSDETARFECFGRSIWPRCGASIIPLTTWPTRVCLERCDTTTNGAFWSRHPDDWCTSSPITLCTRWCYWRHAAHHDWPGRWPDIFIATGFDIFFIKTCSRAFSSDNISLLSSHVLSQLNQLKSGTYTGVLHNETDQDTHVHPSQKSFVSAVKIEKI